MFMIYLLLPLALGAVPASTGKLVIKPGGQLARRIEMVRNRLLYGDVPRFTDDFILADIALRPNYVRRFDEYSGDLSGRVIGAFAMMPNPKTDVRLHNLVHEALNYQMPDGRFGSPELEFTPDQIGRNHMALLWGNGRLLVGLLEDYARHPDPKVLQASKRLGDFLLSVQDACANQQVAARVKNFGAAGMICFTQLIEGLVMLSQATHDQTYLQGAESILPWFQKDRGTQHSHGYLTTLRGVLDLYEATHDAKYLTMVEQLYDSLVHSSDYTVFGGVMEYFGGKGDRTEGCSEADFLRLSLHLWRLTGKMEYLDFAERDLLNEFYANQFSTGDFGHHVIAGVGIAPGMAADRAWWCCTMHGLRAFRDVLDSIVTVHNGLVKINLFTDAQWSDGARSLKLDWKIANGNSPQLSVTVEKAPADGVRLAVRKPYWASAYQFVVVGANVTATEQNGYLTLGRSLEDGDQVNIAFTCHARIVKRDGGLITLDQLGKDPVQGALFYGPWLLGVDQADNPLYFGEPMAKNCVYLPPELASDDTAGAAGQLAVPCAHVKCAYQHDGFPGVHAITLRPVSECSAHGPAPFAIWLNYAAEQ